MPQTPLIPRHAITCPVFTPITSEPAKSRSVVAYPWNIENRLDLSEEELARACVLLDHARHQQYFAASPCQSQFKVGSSVYCGQNRIAHGSNAEYGGGPRRAYDEGVHSEEVAVVNALNHHGRDVSIQMIALASDAPTPSTSCGKCRSLLETYGQPDVIVVSVGADTCVTMWRLSELFPNDLHSLSRLPLSDVASSLLSDLLQAAERARQVGFTHFSEHTLGRSVTAIAAKGSIFALPRIDSLAFYGTSSLRASLSAALLEQPQRLDAVLISSKTGLPTGEERQLLFEFASFLDQTENLPVYLHAEGTGRVVITTPSALLPLGFGPKDLNITFRGPR